VLTPLLNGVFDQFVLFVQNTEFFVFLFNGDQLGEVADVEVEEFFSQDQLFLLFVEFLGLVLAAFQEFESLV